MRSEAWKIQDFNGVWARDLAIPVRGSNQLSYEATDVGNSSFVGSNVLVSNESMMKWYKSRYFTEIPLKWRSAQRVLEKFVSYARSVKIRALLFTCF